MGGTRRVAAAAALLSTLSVAFLARPAAGDGVRSDNDDGRGDDSRLLSVQVVSRHGTRASNGVVENICPGDSRNIEAYQKMGLTDGGMTGVGMQELYDLGVFTRQAYVERDDLLPARYSAAIRVQAVASERTLQSAVCFGQGLFPIGEVPAGYVQRVSAPLPVYSEPTFEDNLLEARMAGCHARLARDVAAFDSVEGRALFAKHERLVAEVERLCAGPDWSAHNASENLGDSWKDVTDGMTFDADSGMRPMPGLTMETLNEARELAVKNLFGRLYGTDEQRTYMAGALPAELVRNMDESVGRRKDKKGTVMWAYHGHREMMYALSFFWGIPYEVPSLGVPKGAIPPGSTLFFELRERRPLPSRPIRPGGYARRGWVPLKVVKAVNESTPAERAREDERDLFVRVLLWTPCKYREKKEIPHVRGVDCPAQVVRLRACGNKADCSFAEFKRITQGRIQRTGAWDELCGAGISTATSLAAVGAGPLGAAAEAARRALSGDGGTAPQHPAPAPSASGHNGVFLVLLVIVTAAAVGFAVMWRSAVKQLRREQNLIVVGGGAAAYRATAADEGTPLL